jgi:hypothetical protein
VLAIYSVLPLVGFDIFDCRSHSLLPQAQDSGPNVFTLEHGNGGPVGFTLDPNLLSVRNNNFYML